MAGYLYRIETPSHKALADYINAQSYFICKVFATAIGRNQVIVREEWGNCVDALNDAMDRFPGSYYLL